MGTYAFDSSEMSRNSFAHLEQLGGMRRGVLLSVATNSGMAIAQRRYMLANLLADQSLPARGFSIWGSTAGGVDPSLDLLEERQSDFLRASDDARIAWKDRIGAIGFGKISDSLSEYFQNSEDKLFYPALPWDERDAENIEGEFALTSSPRTVDWYVNDIHVCTLKIDLPRSVRDREVKSYGWRYQLQLALMRLFFRVDTRFDSQHVGELDSLHSLTMSELLEGLFQSEKFRDAAFLRERSAFSDGTGAWCIIRDRDPFPKKVGRSILIPYLSVVGEPQQRDTDMFSCICRAVRRDPTDVAIQLALQYLDIWWQLLYFHSVILLVPHAQNASFELLENNSVGRIVLRDMRDVELWRNYAHQSSLHQRLSSIDAAYLRYQMCAHPVHYDIAGRPDLSRSSKTGWLAASVFAYSFQMLRKHVLRQFEVAVRAIEPSGVQYYRDALARRFEELADGDGASNSSGLSGGARQRSSSVRMRAAWRRMCDMWIRRAIDLE